MVTVGQGSAEQVTSNVETLGTNIVMVMPGRDNMERGSSGGADQPFRLRYVEAVEQQLRKVDVAAPLSQGRARVVFGNENWRTDIVGTDNRYFKAARWELAAGRVFEPTELQSGRPVCVIGETVRNKLFGTVNPIGERIRIKSLACEIIGLTRSKGASPFGSA